MRELRGQVAIITGASSGIGRATALAFAREGVQLVLAARREDRLREVAAAVEAMGVGSLVVPTDVAVERNVGIMVEEAIARFGRVDILVNNAGYGLFASVEDTTREDLWRIMQVNFMGAFYATRAVLPIMQRQRRGHIINVSSVVGRRGLPFSGAYCATKAAMVAFSESLRMELTGTGISVSVVCPAGTATEFFDVAQTKLGRRGRPIGPVQSAERVAQAVVQIARRPRPEIMTYKPARLLAVLNVFAPRIVDWGIGRMMKRNQPARLDQAGAAKASSS